MEEDILLVQSNIYKEKFRAFSGCDKTADQQCRGLSQQAADHLRLFDSNKIQHVVKMASVCAVGFRGYHLFFRWGRYTGKRVMIIGPIILIFLSLRTKLRKALFLIESVYGWGGGGGGGEN
jgi:hypothetical protein